PVLSPSGRADPKRAGFGPEEPNGCSVLMASRNPQRGQHDLVEGGAGGDTGHLQRDVIDHVLTFAFVSSHSRHSAAVASCTAVVPPRGRLHEYGTDILDTPVTSDPIS